MVREQWDQLVGAYPTVKDPPTSCHSSHLESGENEDDLDVEGRVESIVARCAEVEGALTEIPEEVEKATADLQAFLDGDYSTVYRWVEEGLERTSKEAESKHCIGVTQNVLDEHFVSVHVLCNEWVGCTCGHLVARVNATNEYVRTSSDIERTTHIGGALALES